MVGLHYSEQQLAAVDLVLSAVPGSVVAVTGEAGTGKTTTLRLLLDKISSDESRRYALAAPTGKAAKRISESTEEKAGTLHKLLGYGQPRDLNEETGEYRDSTAPKYDAQNPLPLDLIILDEASMIAQQQKGDLLAAVLPHTVIALFGDIEQLPPVETEPQHKNTPSWFKQVLDSGKAVRLDQVYRQAEKSPILKNARAALRGEQFEEAPEFKIVRTESPHRQLKHLLKHCPDFKEPHSQIVLPRQTGALGARAASFALQEQIWGKDRILREGLQIFRHKWDSQEPLRLMRGDKVVFTKNHYRSESNPFEVFNGETGVVTQIHSGGNERFSVDLGDRVVTVPSEIRQKFGKNREKIVYPERDVHLAYALTTHKTQGSEYKAIAYVMSEATQFMQSKANKYTAITRAKEKVFILSDASSLGEDTGCSIF